MSIQSFNQSNAGIYIPEEMFKEIFKYLNISELKKIKTVNKLFCSFIDSELSSRTLKNKSIKITFNSDPNNKSDQKEIMETVVKLLNNQAYVVVRINNPVGFSLVQCFHVKLNGSRCRGNAETTDIEAFRKHYDIVFLDVNPPAGANINQGYDYAEVVKHGFGPCLCDVADVIPNSLEANGVPASNSNCNIL